MNMTKSAAHEIGAQHQRQKDDGSWRDIRTAPKDGTFIEIKNSYGVAPSYGVHHWTDECRTTDGEMFKTDFHWGNPNERSYPSEGSHLSWRPYDGDPAAYIDPTCGAQKDSAYWRGAVAAKYNLPSDYFEEKPPSIWQRLFGTKSGNRR